MGDCSVMKTKIIYISGGEIFNMNDVHDAFETVRRELGLGMDTVLFGVPVDAQDALGGQFESAQPAVVDETPTVLDEEPKAEPIIEAVVETTVISEPVVAIEKPKRTRKKNVADKVPETPVVDDVKPIIEEIQSEPVIENEPEKEVIPILSVLGGDTIKDDDADLVSIVDDAKPMIDESIDILDDEPKLAPHIQDDFDGTDIDDDIPTIKPEATTIEENDDEDNQLEKLLQSVQSLHEDKDETAPELQVIDNTIDETDATLEKLANEFAENQDKIENTTKSSARGGRIGKLKNILPFKKAKRNESSLMGDLFGWAGVAANDEEFAIPEFFPTAVKK